MSDPVYNAYLLNSPFQIGSTFTSRGDWSATTPYSINDVVGRNGSSYVATAQSTGVEPPNTSYWALLASKGDTGPTGPTGATGTPGASAQWVSDSNSWTYGAATGTSAWTVSVNADVTGYISAGDRVRLTHGGATKYFIVHAVSYSSPSTTLTLFGGTQYALTNSAITSPSWSSHKSPVGFPLRTDYWSLSMADYNGVTFSWLVPSPPVSGVFESQIYRIYTFYSTVNNQRARGVWSNTVTNYAVNDVVMYSNTTYICTAAPIPSYPNPSVDTAHWQPATTKKLTLCAGAWSVMSQGSILLRGLSGSMYRPTVGIGTLSGSTVSAITDGTVSATTNGYSSLTGTPSLLDSSHDVLIPFRHAVTVYPAAATDYCRYITLDYTSATGDTAGFILGWAQGTSTTAISAYL